MGLYEDTFNRAGPALGANWTDWTAGMGINAAGTHACSVAGFASPFTSPRAVWYQAVPISDAGTTVSDVHLDKFGGSAVRYAGVIVRGVDVSNHYMVYIYDTGMVMLKKAGGVWGFLDSGDASIVMGATPHVSGDLVVTCTLATGEISATFTSQTTGGVYTVSGTDAAHAGTNYGMLATFVHPGSVYWGINYWQVEWSVGGEDIAVHRDEDSTGTTLGTKDYSFGASVPLQIDDHGILKANAGSGLGTPTFTVVDGDSLVIGIA